jgi:hypothetical protein
MPWVAAAFIALALFLVGTLVAAGLAYGVQLWLDHRRQARCRFADIQARVAELRVRTGSREQAAELPRPPASSGRLFLDTPTVPLPGLGPPPIEGVFRIGGHVRHTADTRRLPRIHLRTRTDQP